MRTTKKIVEQCGIYGGKINDNVQRLYSEIQPNDLIWMRKDGLYYLGRVSAESHWSYVNDNETLENDAANQVNGIAWHLIGDKSDVPGSIATALIRGKVLQHIWKAGTLIYLQILYNEKVGHTHYKTAQMESNSDTFFSLLSTDDCEDLLCLWLYKKIGYVCVSSTNKKSIELYECVLRDLKIGKHIYLQVKVGEVTINATNYLELDGEVWLLTTKGRVIGLGDESESIHIASPEQLFKFTGSTEARNILPCSIVKWYAKLTT